MAISLNASSLSLELKQLAAGAAGEKLNPDQVLQALEKHRPLFSTGGATLPAGWPATAPAQTGLSPAANQRLRSVKQLFKILSQAGEARSAARVQKQILARPDLLEAVIPAFKETDNPHLIDGLTDLLSASISPGRLLTAWQYWAAFYPLPSLEKALIKAGRRLQKEPFPTGEQAEENTVKTKRFCSFELCRPILEYLNEVDSPGNEHAPGHLVAPDNTGAGGGRNKEAGEGDKDRRDTYSLLLSAARQKMSAGSAADATDSAGYCFAPDRFQSFCRRLLLNPQSRLAHSLCVDLALAADPISLKDHSRVWLTALSSVGAAKAAALLAKLAFTPALTAGSRARLCRAILTPIYRDKTLKKELVASLEPLQLRQIRRQVSLFNLREHCGANPVKYHFFMSFFDHILRAVKIDGSILILRFRDFYLVDNLAQPDKALLWNKPLFEQQVNLKAASSYFTDPPFPVGHLTTRTAVSAKPLTGIIEVSFTGPDFSLTQNWFAQQLNKTAETLN